MAPSDPRPYYNRGLMEADQHDFVAARRDFTRAVALPPINDYAYVRLWLVRARLGDRPAATTDLAAVIPVRTAAHADEWTLTVARFLVGQITETDLFAKTTAADATATKGRECEAHFYSGWIRLIEGDRAKAKEAFEKCLATGMDTYYEFTSAKAELRAMGGSQ
jgi:lipoprotein NlpI